MHYKLRAMKRGAVAMLALGLGACGGDEPSITATEVNIDSFSVEGTSDPLPTRPTPINADENDGRFHVRWALTTNGVVDVGISVGEAGSIPFANTEYTFFEKRCGPGAGCPLGYDLACQFTHDNRIECTDAQGTDLTPFLDRMPKQASIQIVVQGDGRGAAQNTNVEFQ